MKIKIISFSIGLILTMPLYADTQLDIKVIEERLNLLEKRAIEAERKAAIAEQKAARLEQLITSKKEQKKNNYDSELLENTNNNSIEQRVANLEKQSNEAQQRVFIAQNELTKIKKQQNEKSNFAKKDKGEGFFSTNTKWGDLKLYGDAEFNIDAKSKKGQLTSIRSMSNSSSNVGDNGKWGLSGGISIGIDGTRKLANGNYAGIFVEPFADISGEVDLSDSVFYFGKQDQWRFQIGRYRAYNMFRSSQDTFIEYSGNTASDLYGDGFGYVYMMKEGRGRSRDGGGMMFSKNYNNWYFELNTIIEDGTSVFRDKKYHGRDLDNRKNAMYLRPVIEWKKDNLTLAGAIETNVIRNAYGYQDSSGNFFDQSRRTGYGLTMRWNTLENNPVNGIIANLNTAYLDANDESDFSFGANILWRRFFFGYIYAHNNIKAFYIPNNKEGGYDHDKFNLGKYSINTFYLSYEIPDILEMDNLKIYLGAYYSKLEGEKGINIHNSDTTRYGTRIKFIYYF